MVEMLVMPPKSFALPECESLRQDELRSSGKKIPRGAFTFKLVFVGNPGVGKTSLVYRLAEERLPGEHRPTLGVNILTKVTHICRDTDIKWIIWDVGSQRRMEHLRKVFYRGAAAILLVFDKTNPASLEALEKFWLSELDEAKVDLSRVPVVIIANKDDIAAQDPIVVEETRSLMNWNSFTSSRPRPSRVKMLRHFLNISPTGACQVAPKSVTSESLQDFPF